MIATKSHTRSYESWSEQLSSFNTTQISLQNGSQDEQWVKIWGANQGISNQKKATYFATNTYPQTIQFNPINKAVYVVNQLASSLQIFNKNGSLLNEIVLDQNSIPTASPVDIEINSITGEAYVIGSISNLLYVVSLNLELTRTIALNNRPFSIRFNSKTNKLYVQHLLITTVSVLDLNEDFLIVLKEMNSVQSGIAVNAINGNWASLSNESKKVLIFNEENTLINSFEIGLVDLESLLFSKDGNKVFAVVKSEKKLLTINVVEGTIEQSIPFKNQPYSIQIGKSDHLIISTTEPNSFIELDDNLQFISTLTTPIKPFRWTVHLEEGTFYITDPINNRIAVVGNNQTSPITFSDNYNEALSDFQHQPILLKHLKVFYSALNQIPLIRIGTKSSSGKLEQRLISLHKYSSPQQSTAIYDVREIANEIIDGRAFWEVLIPPKQHMTMILYHK